VAGDVRSAEFGVEGMASLRCIAVDEERDEGEARVGDRLALIVEDRLSGQRLAFSGAATEIVP